MKINLIILTINTYIIYKSGQLIYSANKVISLYKQDSPIVYFVPNRTVIKKSEGGNLAASKIRNLECPSYEICLIDYGCGKFNRKIHIMEQYP